MQIKSKHILCSTTFPQKSCRLWDDVGKCGTARKCGIARKCGTARKCGLARKCGTARKATDDNIIRRMRIGCWVTKATNTHSEFVMLTAFFTTTMVTRRASIFRLYVQYIACVAETTNFDRHPRRQANISIVQNRLICLPFFRPN